MLFIETKVAVQEIKKTRSKEIYLVSRASAVDIQPVSILWDTCKPENYSIQNWRIIQISRFISAFPQATPSKLLKWTNSHDINPWPSATRNGIAKILNRIRKRNSGNDGREDADSMDCADFRDAKVKDILQTLEGVDEKMRTEILKKLYDKGQSSNSRIFNLIAVAIKEVLLFTSSNYRKYEAVRSTILGTICAPSIPLKDVAEAMEIYGNRNFHKLKLYRERRQAFIGGSAENMSGRVYAPDCYGFPKEVVTFLRG